MEEIKHS